MPTPSQMQLPKSKSADEFECMCCDVLSIFYNTKFQQYGRNGQQQHGIDLYSNNQFSIVAQCKNYFKSTDIIKMLKSDYESAMKQFNPKKFIAMTALERDTNIQYQVSQIGENIFIWFWEDIQNIICSNNKLLISYYQSFVPYPNKLYDTSKGNIDLQDVFNVNHIKIYNDYYVNDSEIIFIKYCKTKIITPTNKLHNRITWFADETYEITSLTDNAHIEFPDLRDTNINYDVVFDKEFKESDIAECTVKAILSNNHKHFENFLSTEIINPINDLYINLTINNASIKKIYTQKLYASPMNPRSEPPKENILGPTFHWHIPNPDLHFEYKIYW